MMSAPSRYTQCTDPAIGLAAGRCSGVELLWTDSAAVWRGSLPAECRVVGWSTEQSDS